MESLENMTVPVAYVKLIASIDSDRVYLEEMKKKDDKLFSDRWNMVQLFLGKGHILNDKVPEGAISAIGYRKAMEMALDLSGDNFFEDVWLDWINGMVTGSDMAAETVMRKDSYTELFKEVGEEYFVLKQDKDIHPLLNVAWTFRKIVSMGLSYKAGNTQVLELLMQRMLSDNGYDIGKYDVYNRKEIRVLIQKNHKKNPDESFILKFLEWIFMSYKDVVKYVQNPDTRSTAASMPAKTGRIKRVLMESDVPISKSEICRMLPDVSMATVEKYLANFSREGNVQKSGNNRTAKYLWVGEKEK